MKTLTVLELSKLYNINRQTIYNNIKKGILSKNSDNKIDLAEAIRVFGEPIKKQDVKEPVKIDSQNSAEVLLLRQQIDMLKNQLDDAKDRESFYQNQIETMQRLLEAPKAYMPTSIDPNTPESESIPEENNAKVSTSTSQQESEVKNDGLTTPEQTENKRIPVPEQVEPEQPKRGFWSRFFLPNG